ncbi:very short patch repair endonuclease [Pedococcus ginsenosidimutans]|uniref:Very short patch repair endonuclease n=1 Tax=Pedococcus ginsenosidimutans TaxID=490570 RepID=A0ABP8XXD8_9MICO
MARHDSGETSPSEPDRVAPDARLSTRFSNQARQATAPELALRRELHRRGLRYRVQVRIPGLPRRRPDIVFTRAKVAVFVDGCFWHACPDHCIVPKANREWWLWKFAVNRERDADTNKALADLGWAVVRIWEHESISSAADAVMTVVRDRRARLAQC